MNEAELTLDDVDAYAPSALRVGRDVVGCETRLALASYRDRLVERPYVRAALEAEESGG